MYNFGIITVGGVGTIVNDYSAELVVASKFAEAGWNVYFPHRDQGFDFIISKEITDFGEMIMNMVSGTEHKNLLV